ncbi:hypothetical protein ACLIYP_00365 [Streptomyces nanhaiensis]|uniref:AbiJ-related protein n=1 Tax=Streptomyces nanhaiensis TaxID=679319 RepID=UPI00399C6F0D
MAGETDHGALRQLLEHALSGLGDANTHRTLPGACARLGLPQPPEEGSKRERVMHSLKALPDGRLPDVAQRVIRDGLVDPAARNTIQDALWAAQNTPQIPKKTRREIARALDLADLARHPGRFMALLDRLWVLDDDPLLGLLTSTPTGLRARIDRHVLRNPGDWSTEELLEQLGAFDAGDARFARFLEGLVSADTIPDEPAQRRLTATINPHLHTAAAELREMGTDGGYPVFTLVSTRTARTRRPKNLVFATLTKPDIRFRDAVDNDIEVLGDTDDVLVYDRPIGADGLRWRDLQAWWKDQRTLPGDTEAKRSLYARLTRCLPDTSPPQRTLFDLYHEIHGPTVYGLPALLPEVWLHWDPKTVRARGAQALLNFRMDFLLLLPHGHRIVLEVDGMHHYTTQGRPDSAKYAANMRGDRDLKLAGYEVFRFGAHELRDRDRARALLQQFFHDLFRQFDVTPRAD